MMRGSSFKRKIINTRRVFGAGLHSFFRNAWLSTAATIVMTITLGSILLTVFASITSSNTIQSFTDKIDLSVYFKIGIAKTEVNVLIDDLQENQDIRIREITYVSEQQARASFIEQNKDDIKTLQAISQSEDAFPASIRVKTSETSKLAEVAKIVRQDRYAGIVDGDSYKDDAKRTAVDRLGNIATFCVMAV